MPLGPVAEFILQPIAEAVLHILGYLTARVLIPVVTLGRARVAPWDSWPKARTGRAHRVTLRVPGSSPTGVRVIDAEFAALLGFMFWLVVIIVGTIAWYHHRR